MRNSIESDEFWIASDGLIYRLRDGKGRESQQSQEDLEEAYW